MKKFFIIVGILMPNLLFTASQQLASQNSQWRGENRDGIYNETGLLKEWPADGPQLLWKQEGLGAGYSSVAIANGKIFVTGMPDKNLIIFVFDMKGTLLAKKTVGKEWTGQYPGTRCTVVVNDGKLYINNSLGTLVCLDEATLNEVWKKDLLTDFDGRNVMWGMTESPLIVGEKIFVTPGGVKHNMIALNKNTGALIWSSPGDGATQSYCSPQYIADQSIPIVVTHTMQQIIAFNADTGEKLWSHPQINYRNIHPNTPIYSDGMLFSTTGYRGGSLMLRLKNGGKAVEQVWKNEELDNQIGGAVKVGDYIYASGHEASRDWFCVDWKTGQTKYKARGLSQCCVIATDGMLYVYSDRGTMNLIKPNPEKYELVSSFAVKYGTDNHWAHPVIHRGVLYIRRGDALMAYNLLPL